jgi:intracellular sulfur oxidation DsrE/DsrF family protein
MKRRTFFCLALVVVTCRLGFSQTPANPIIKDFGTINKIDEVAPNEANLDYKIVIDLKSSNENYKAVNKGLNNVARLLNLHGVAGVPLAKLHVAVAVHYTATPIILDNAGYQKKYGVDNPNLELIEQLKEAGVKLYVCGQSLVARKYAFEDVNPDVEIALSMLTVVTEKTMQGYQLLVFE